MKIVKIVKNQGRRFVEWEVEVEMEPTERDELIQFIKLRTLHRSRIYTVNTKENA